MYFRDCYQEYFATFEVANHIIDRALRARSDENEDSIMQQLGRFVQVIMQRKIFLQYNIYSLDDTDPKPCVYY